MKRILNYFNPVSQLGNTHYSFVFPLLLNCIFIFLSEFFAYQVLEDPLAVGSYVIFVNVTFILYFAFRDGLLGGFISVAAAISYYFYIMYTRQYSGTQLDSGIEVTISLAFIYSLLAAVIGWLKQTIDRLIQKEADGKKRLETIIQQLPVGIIITDHEGRVIERNTKVDDILGLKVPLGFVMGQDPLPDVKIDGQPVRPAQSPLFEAIRTGKPVLSREIIFERRDKTQADLQINSAPVHNAAGKVIAAASIITDITRQKALERQKDEFLGIASHELRTPVTSIKAYGQFLQRLFATKGDKSAVDQLKKMDTQVNKLTSLISDLLDVTKIQAGHLVLYPELFAFNDLVTEIAHDMQMTARSHRILKKFGKNAVVYADRERVGQVLTNLISNAIKYSPQATKIVVRTQLKKRTVTFSVEDFGIGIAPDKKNKVFERFFRAHGPSPNTYAGLGLGLYVSAQIVKREKGAIWVESKEGRGSTFYVSLPLAVKRKQRKSS